MASELGPRPLPNGPFDIAFVGAGVATAFSLMSCVTELMANGDRRRTPAAVRIAVFERASNGFGGAPYGRQSGHNSLIITPLRDFLPADELAAFVEWLNVRRDELLDEVARNPGANTERWLRANRPAIERGEWGDLYIPRQFFGRYINERVGEVVSAAEAEGLVDFEFHQATVVDAGRVDGRIELIVAPADDDALFRCTADTLVLGLGSMPLHKRFGSTAGDVRLIDDLYWPGLPQNVAALEEVLEATAGTDDEHRTNVLVLGANASALETLYVLDDSRSASLANATYYVMSPSGAFPGRIRPPVRTSKCSLQRSTLWRPQVR